MRARRLVAALPWLAALLATFILQGKALAEGAALVSGSSSDLITTGAVVGIIYALSKAAQPFLNAISEKKIKGEISEGYLKAIEAAGFSISEAITSTNNRALSDGDLKLFASKLDGISDKLGKFEPLALDVPGVKEGMLRNTKQLENLQERHDTLAGEARERLTKIESQMKSDAASLLLAATNMATATKETAQALAAAAEATRSAATKATRTATKRR